ncbi:MAG TPA: lytic transglycosylase domain-containing protein [Pseudolabrys sp.]|nr:lytic transglycosylase domain-containing protein [Pseudolabrys sp.]
MTGSEELLNSAEAETVTVIDKTTRVATSEQTPPTAPATSEDPAPNDDTQDTPTNSQIDIDIPLPPPVTTLAPELRDPTDSFIAEKAADRAAKPAVADRIAKPANVPLPVRREPSRAEVCAQLASAAQNNDIPVPFLIRLIWQESGFDPKAVSRVGAQGMAQFMPETARTVGLQNPFDPLQAVAAAARLLRGLVQQFGNLGLAAAAYNAGPKRISDWVSHRGKLPAETRSYVTNITGQAPERWKGASAQAAMTVPRHAPCQREALIAAMNAPHPVDPAPQVVAAEPVAKPAQKVIALVPRKSKGRMSMVIKIAALPRRGSAPAPIQLSAHSRVAAKGHPAAAKRVHIAMSGHRH